MIQVAGSRIIMGEVERKYKYRVVRGENIIQDNLKIHSMKKLQVDVTKVEKGQECGLALENFESDLQSGDLIECYKETVGKVTKFAHKAGVTQSY
jgi:translation initiation factor IF-2